MPRSHLEYIIYYSRFREPSTNSRGRDESARVLALALRHRHHPRHPAANKKPSASPPPHLNKDGGRCAVGTEMVSCGSSCDNAQGRIRVHYDYGIIYVADEF